MRDTIMFSPGNYNPVPILMHEEKMRRAVENYLQTKDEIPYFGEHLNETGEAALFGSGKIYVERIAPKAILFERTGYYHPAYL